MKIVHPTGVRIATLTGAVVNLAANEVRDLPQALVALALGHGAHLVDENEEPEQVTQSAAPVPTIEPVLEKVVLATETDHEKLVRIMKDIIARADPADFRADKEPKNSILNRMFGKVVTEELRTAAWAEATKVA